MNTEQDKSYKPFEVGDKTVRLLVPSRSMHKLPLDPELIQQQLAKVQSVFEELFNGTAPLQPPLLGTYRHPDGSVTREDIRIVESTTSLENIRDASIRERVFKLAADVCRDMDQQCVFVVWGNTGWVVDDNRPDRNAPVVRFARLAAEVRERMLCFSWIGIHEPHDVLQVLSLDGWVKPAKEQKQGEAQLLAQRGEGPGSPRLWLEPSPRHAWAKKALTEGDLILSAAENGLQLRHFRGGRLHGPKMLHYSDVGPNVPTAQILRAVLMDDLEDLTERLDRKDIREGFFRKYRDILFEVQRDIECHPDLKGKAFGRAQLLLGRLMFLKFIEQKGWLAEDYDFLRNRFREHKGSFYRNTLLPLFFDVLNNDKCTREAPSLPFINGGLFHPREHEHDLEIPDALFDRLLGLFNEYQFTLEDTTGTDEAVSVDPSMFGKVLESLVEPEDRKKSGTHYTPKSIARALAFEAILARLATLSGLDGNRLRRFCNGSIEALSPPQANSVLDLLTQLRIVDPAVGSGALLLACLETLMSIAGFCHERMGAPLRRGAFAWGKLCREIVCSCLYGVDLSEEAVEIARLRLWLAVAVGDVTPSPLPDLEFNIRHADSLLEDEVFKGTSEGQQWLNLDEGDALRNRFINAVARYSKAGVEHPVEQHQLLREVEDAQKALVAHLRMRGVEQPAVKRGRKRREDVDIAVSIPFSWRLQFGHVFAKSRGFDVVIANPPYVRTAQIDKGLLEKYRKRWKVLKKGNVDLYFGFIELALDLVAPDGEVAYIMPNFSRSSSGGSLRSLLAESATIRRWVDFDDAQVFPTATNYVALLFATKRPRTGKTFPCSCIRDRAWEEQVTSDWIFRKMPSLTNLVEVPYEEDHEEDTWLTVPKEDADCVRQMKQEGTPLGDLVEVGVGIQTSADELYLFEESREASGQIEVFSRGDNKWHSLERAFLRTCIKGARDKSASGQEILAVWPYGSDAKLLSADELSRKFPKGWKYLKKFEKKLRARESGKFDHDRWFDFGRGVQGVAASGTPKVIVPAIHNESAAFIDKEGKLTFTASGEGGGGAWSLIPKSKALSLEALGKFMKSEAVTRYYRVMGFPKRNGWRGVDKSVLDPLPVPKEYLH